MYLLKFQHQFHESSDGNLHVEREIQDWAAGRTSALDCAGEVIEADANGEHLSEGMQLLHMEVAASMQDTWKVSTQLQRDM